MLTMRLNLVAAVALATALTSPASAQDLPSEAFESKPVHGTSVWTTSKTDVPDHLTASAGIILHFADDPVVLYDEERNTVAKLVDHQLKADLGIGFGLFDLVEIGFVLPIILIQEGESFEGLTTASSPAFADVRASAKARIVDWKGLGVGAELVASIPTGEGEAYQSNGTPAVMPVLVADWSSDSTMPIIVAGNVGWRVRPEQSTDLLATDDVFDWRLASEVGVLPQQLHLMATAHGTWQALADTEDPISGEFVGGGRIFWGGGWTSTFGAGTGIASGYGSPDVRVLASISYAPGIDDRDGDGLSSSNDQCFEGEEDVDGFQDSDGCPDPDNDFDNIMDVDDGCPNQPEDVDGFDDKDGCPDPDNDGDGVADFDDACPLESGAADRAGCPFVDEDGDGIESADDRCPDVAEDQDGFEDEDGCPDPDNDRDGIADETDKCPNEPESINGIDDEDGCPDQGDSAVRLSGNRIEILEKVYFDTNRATIKQRSHGVLQQVASLMKANPEIKVLRVEGHTDSRGSDDNNLELSQQRAAAVKQFLIDNGVGVSRLSARGYGESHPVATNETSKGRAENRRVEFHIIEREVSK